MNFNLSLIYTSTKVWLNKLKKYLKIFTNKCKKNNQNKIKTERKGVPV